MKYWMEKIILFALTLLLIAMSSGCGGGAPIRGGSAYYDMHYRNPWYGYHGELPPPHYIGPPPIVIPPGIPDLPPLEAVPLPM
ncbi:hypothetical protein [Kaarinaea lacus]